MRSTLSIPSAHGFTLMELLISICILSMIVGIVYTGLSTVSDTSDAVRARAERMRLRQFVARQFRSALSTLYIDTACQQPELALVGTDEQGTYGAADTLLFCSNGPMGGTMALPGMMKTVSYSVVDGGGEALGSDLLADASVLLIEETPLVLAEPGDEMAGEERQTPSDFYASFFGDEQDLSARREIPVQSVNFQYFDGEMQEWVDSWDSSFDGVMPWAVRVMVNFPRDEQEMEADRTQGINPEESPDLDLTVVLPMTAGTMGPFVDLNHQREPDLTEDLDNMTGDIKQKSENERNARRNSQR